MDTTEHYSKSSPDHYTAPSPQSPPPMAAQQQQQRQQQPPPPMMYPPTRPPGPVGAHNPPNPPRRGPATAYYVFDLIAKLIAAISLLGIMIVLAMMLPMVIELRERLVDDNLRVVLEQNSSPYTVTVQSSSYDPIYMEVVD